MLIIELRVNYRIIKTIGVHNVHPNAAADFTGECPYDVYVADDGSKFHLGHPLTRIHHRRMDGAEILAAKALTVVKEIEGKETT
jgi:hypothetical protein